MNLQEQLFSLQDLNYRDFHSRLVPTVDPERIIGVRVPALRKLTRSLDRESQQRILSSLPHFYYEENCLHGFLIEQIRDYDGCVAALNEFLPHVYNWATCDMTSPKALGTNLSRLWTQCQVWIASDHIYTIRFGILSLRRHCLDDSFREEALELVADLRSEEYYVNMARAWYFAEALAKQYDAALPYLLNHRLDPWTHNKAIQKARESYRISPEQKAYLKTIKC